MPSIEYSPIDTGYVLTQLFLDLRSADLYAAKSEEDARVQNELANWEVTDAISGSGRGYDSMDRDDMAEIGDSFAKSKLLDVISLRAVRDYDQQLDKMADFFYRNTGRLVHARVLRADTVSITDLQVPTRPLTHQLIRLSGIINGYFDDDSFGVTVKRPRFSFSRTHHYAARMLNGNGKVITKIELSNES